jgi:hypothetical protein
MDLIRRDLLLGAGALTLAGCATTGGSSSGSGFRYAAASVSPSPKEVGGRVAAAYLAVTPILRIDRTNTRTYYGVHYADAACAYGAGHLAAATGDAALLGQVKARHDRVLAQNIENSGTHVDVNV